MIYNERLLGHNIAWLVDQGAITRSELARAMNVSQQAVGQLIRGETKGLKPLNLVRAARAVGRSVEQLVTADLSRLRPEHEPRVEERGVQAIDQRVDALISRIREAESIGCLSPPLLSLLENALSVGLDRA